MSRKNGIFLALFGAVFFAIGAGMGVFSTRSMRQAESMLHWNASAAKVLSCELKHHRSSKGSGSYSVHAQYEYEVDGVTYQNDRVGLSSGADNVGSFQRDTYRQFEKSRREGKPVNCWVNPENAADSILIREPRIPLLMLQALFVLIFGTVGLSVSLSGMLMARTPGLSSAKFYQPRIPMRGRSTYKIALAAAVYWNAFTLWMSWKVLVVFTRADIPLYFWLLAASGAIPALVAAYMFLRFNKYGISVFEMSPVPGVLGGPIAGNIRIPKPIEIEQGVDLTLQCVHQYTTRSGKSSTTHRNILWNDTRRVETVYNDGAGMVLPVRFTIPSNQPATDTAGNGDGHYWQLKAKAKTAGIDYAAVFDVPVTGTELR